MTRGILILLLLLLLRTQPAFSEGNPPHMILDKGESLLKQGKASEGVKELCKLYPLYPKFQNDKRYAAALKEAGTLCFSVNRYIESLRFFRMSRRVGELSGDRKTEIASSGNIGVVFAVMGDNGTAAHYLENAFENALAEGYADLAHIYANNLVVALCEINETELAEKYAKKNLELTNDTTPECHFRLIKDEYLIAEARKDTKGMMESASKVYDHVMRYNLGPFYKTAAFEFLANVYQQTCKYDSAIYYYKLSLNEVRNENMYDLYLKKLKKLSNVYFISGNTRDFETVQAEIKKLNDSIYSPKVLAATKKEFWNLEEQSKNDYINELTGTIDNQHIIITIVSVALTIMIVLTGVIVHLLKKRQDMYRDLYERNLELTSPSPDESSTEEVMEAKETLISSDWNGCQATEETTEKCADEDDNELRKQKLLADIITTMSNVTIVTNPDFNLNTLVREVGSNVNYVSGVINSMLHKNFKSYLNEQRIMEACRRLRENYDDYPSIAALGESVGYRAESSFFQAFKKIVGMTPLEYHRISVKS